MKYSTVDEYLSEIHKQNFQYPVYYGDFLPYIQEAECKTCDEKTRIDYWTGYFSSKPHLKGTIRDLFNWLRKLQKFNS